MRVTTGELPTKEDLETMVWQCLRSMELASARVRAWDYWRDRLNDLNGQISRGEYRTDEGERVTG